MGDGVRVRSPFVEELLRQGIFLVPGEGRNLSSDEQHKVRQVFGSSIDLTVVRLVFSNVHVNNRAYTLGNTVRFPRAIALDDRTLIHELAHVWQYQTRGSSYISDSIYHQATDGSAAAYNVTIVPNQSIYQYTAEQQATIVERYFAKDPSGWETDPDVLRMMEEVRRARPLSEASRQEDLIYGPGGGRQFDFSNPGRPEERPAPIVPLFRINF